jgi:hypothetical protein
MVAVLVVSIALCLVARAVLSARDHRLTHAPAAIQLARPEESVSAIRQQTFRQRAAGQDLKAAQRKALQTFSWVDRSRGIVQIPIDVAIDLELAEPTR